MPACARCLLAPGLGSGPCCSPRNVAAEAGLWAEVCSLPCTSVPSSARGLPFPAVTLPWDPVPQLEDDPALPPPLQAERQVHLGILILL